MNQSNFGSNSSCSLITNKTPVPEKMKWLVQSQQSKANSGTESRADYYDTSPPKILDTRSFQ